MPAITKLQRWLDIIAYLVGRHLPVSFDELVRNVPAYAARAQADDETARQSMRRMFERDKDELRGFGIPIRTVRYTIDGGLDEVEGYQIERRDFYLPYLKLVQELSGEQPFRQRHRAATVEVREADAPLALDALRRVARVPGFPLAREARSAFRKLAFDLDPQHFAGGAPVLFIDRPGAAELTARLRVLSEALLARKRVEFDYYGIYRDVRSQRDVAPYGLFFQHGHWYLVGHDETRADVRVFRVGRMDGITPNRRRPKQPDYTIPANFRLDAYIDRESWELGGEDDVPLTAVVLFHFPLALWAERNRHGTLRERRPDGAQLREFAVQQIEPFLRWVLSLEGEATISEPAALQDELRALARAVAAAHGGQS